MDRRAYAAVIMAALVIALSALSFPAAASSSHAVDSWTTTINQGTPDPTSHVVDSWSATVNTPGPHQIDSWTVTIPIAVPHQIDSWSVTVNFTSSHVVDFWNCTLHSPVMYSVDNWTATVYIGLQHQIDQWSNLIKIIYHDNGTGGGGGFETPAIVAQVFGAAGVLMIVIGFAGTAYLWQRQTNIVIVLGFAAFMIIIGIALARSFIGF